MQIDLFSALVGAIVGGVIVYLAWLGDKNPSKAGVQFDWDTLKERMRSRWGRLDNRWQMGIVLVVLLASWISNLLMPVFVIAALVYFFVFREGNGGKPADSETDEGGK